MHFAWTLIVSAAGVLTLSKSPREESDESLSHLVGTIQMRQKEGSYWHTPLSSCLAGYLSLTWLQQATCINTGPYEELANNFGDILPYTTEYVCESCRLLLPSAIFRSKVASIWNWISQGSSEILGSPEVDPLREPCKRMKLVAGTQLETLPNLGTTTAMESLT